MKKTGLLALAVAMLLSFPFDSHAKLKPPVVNFPVTYFTGSFYGDSSGYFSGKLLKNTISFMVIDTNTGALATGSATVKADSTFSNAIRWSNGTHTSFAGMINTDLSSSGTWATFQGRSVLSSGAWSATPMNPTLVQAGAGVWYGSWSAKIFDPSGYIRIPLSGRVGLVTLDDGTVAAVVVYLYRGYYYYMTFSGTWDEVTKQVSVSDDSGLGFSGYGQISSTKISGSLYQDNPNTGNTVRVGSWSVNKF